MTSQLLALAASLALLAGCATGEKPADEKPSGREQTLVERRAVVTGIDQQKLRVGDQVVVSYTEAIAWQVKPSDKGAPGVSTRETLNNPRAGEAPGGAIERAITITATITAFDVARGTVTLTGPQGRFQTVKAHNPVDLEQIRVGDLVDITYSEALALSVRPVVKP